MAFPYLIDDLKQIHSNSRLEEKLIMMLEQEHIMKIRLIDGVLFQYTIEAGQLGNPYQDKTLMENWEFRKEQLEDFFEQFLQVTTAEGKRKVYEDCIFIPQFEKNTLSIGKRVMTSKILEMQRGNL